MKILIGTPYYRTVHAPFVSSLLEMLVCSMSVTNCTHQFMQGTNASRQRNYFAREAIKGGYDYLVTIDSDMVFTPDTLLSYLSVKKPVVGGLYTGRLASNKELLMVFKEDKVKEEGLFVHYNYDELPSTIKPFQVVGVGSALLLVDVRLLEFMFTEEVVRRVGLPFSFWTVPNVNPLGPDLSFCHRLNLMGIEIWVDPRPEIGHICEDILYPSGEDKCEA